MRGNAKYGLLAAGLLLAALLAVTSFYNEGNAADQDEASVVIHEQSSEITAAVKGTKAQRLLQLIHQRKKQIKKKLKTLDHKKMKTHYINPKLRAEQSRTVKRAAKRTKKQMAPAVKVILGKHGLKQESTAAPVSDRKAKNKANSELQTWISRYTRAHPKSYKTTTVTASTPFLKKKVASGRHWQKQVDAHEFAHVKSTRPKPKKASASIISAKAALARAKRDEGKVAKAKAKFKAYEAKVKAKHKAKAKEAKAKRDAKIVMPPMERPALKGVAADVVKGPTDGMNPLKMEPAVVADIAIPPVPNAAEEAKAKAYNKKHVKKSQKKEVKKAIKKAKTKKTGKKAAMKAVKKAVKAAALKAAVKRKSNKSKKKATKKKAPAAKKKTTKKKSKKSKKKSKAALPPMPPVPPADHSKEMEMFSLEQPVKKVTLPSLRRIVHDVAMQDAREAQFEEVPDDVPDQDEEAFASDPLGDWD